MLKKLRLLHEMPFGCLATGGLLPVYSFSAVEQNFACDINKFFFYLN
jgi:hypothetical protein